MELRKLSLKNDNSQNKSMTDSKIVEMNNFNEDLIKENIELKRLLNSKNDDLTKNFLKMKKLNLNLQKEY